MSLGQIHMPEQTLVVTAPDDEFKRLQEQLYQSLTRETEAYKKIKHLHEQLNEAQSSSSRSPNGIQLDSPDITWDTDLSQNSEMSPRSPPPATPTLIVVNGTPQLNTRSRSKSQPCSPIPLGRKILDQPKLPPLNFNCDLHPREQVHPNYANGVDSLTKNAPWSPDSGLHLPTHGHLAPSPRSLKDVRKEREKPPPVSSHTHKRSSSVQGLSKIGNPPTLVHRASSPENMLFSPPPTTDDKERGSSPSPEFPLSTPVPSDKKTATSLERSSSTKNKSKDRSTGHRGRSNTSIMPNWLRRKRSSSENAKKSTNYHTNQPVPTGSIEEHFQSFSRISTNIQRDALAKYVDRPWTEVCTSGECSRDDIQYRNTVWDMFQEETKYLTNLLQPLEQVYKGFLEELHFHGILKIADVDKIFANLSELCELSSSVANDLFRLFDGRSESRIAPNRELILAFSMFGHKFNPVYQRFCVNFEKQRGLVRALQQLPEFQEYLKICRTHELVGKRDLSDLLISPMQHQCHYQLLLEKVLKYTKDPEEKSVLSSTIKAFVVSLKELEGNIDENKRSAELLELQETLSWPTVVQLDTDAYIPEAIQSSLSTQPSSELLASKDRQLVYKGSLKLFDSKAKPCQELHAFLFTDLLLLTELKSRKKESCNQLIRYQVFGHPLFLESLELYDVPFNQTHKHVITLVEKTVLQQRIRVYSFQAVNKDDKVKWITQISHTQKQLWHRQNDQYVESDV